MQLSHHFTLAEMERSQTALRAGIDNHPSIDVINNLKRLCLEILQPIREHFGPVHISSGYRCPELNKHIGGSPRSQHCQGEAADIVIATVKPIDICRFVVEAGLPFDQLIEEGTWTHVSYTDHPRGQVLTAHFENGKATYSEGLLS